VAEAFGKCRLLPLLGMTLLAGCAIHYEMARLSPGGWCPDRPQAEGLDQREGPAVTWYAHPSPEDGAANAAWCATVGPPAVVPMPHSSLPSTPPDTLTVVTWNAWIDGGDFREFAEKELGLSCGPEGPSVLEGFTPFILLIQEAHQRSDLVPVVPEDAPVPWEVGPEERAPGSLDILGTAEACGLSLAYIPSARNGFKSEGRIGEDKGNALLSTLPLRDVLGIEVPFEAGRKVAVGAEFDVGIPGSWLRVVSLHLDVASTLARTMMTGNRTRERQVAGLLDAMDRHGWGVGPAIVGGDFNTWSSRDAALKLVLSRHPESPPITRETSMGPFPADHLFIRGDEDGIISLVPGSYRTLQSLYGSDHQARILRLSLKR
jgi:endonuclease/exonuclease/phosphatase family metal-dependent hydrolase